MNILKIASWTMLGGLSLLFTLSGISKLTGVLLPVMAHEIPLMGYPDWFWKMLSVGELAAGLAVVSPKYRPYGLLFMVFVLCGGLATHITKGDGAKVVPMLVLLSLPIIAIWLNKRVNGATVSF